MIRIVLTVGFQLKTVSRVGLGLVRDSLTRGLVYRKSRVTEGVLPDKIFIGSITAILGLRTSRIRFE